MSLATGTRLGPYQILSAIGAGGMGEAYRARDTKLAREVAIKVLPEGVRCRASRGHFRGEWVEPIVQFINNLVNAKQACEPLTQERLRM